MNFKVLSELCNFPREDVQEVSTQILEPFYVISIENSVGLAA